LFQLNDNGTLHHPGKRIYWETIFEDYVIYNVHIAVYDLIVTLVNGVIRNKWVR